MGQRGKGHIDENQLDEGRGHRRGNHLAVAPVGADKRHHALEGRHRKRQHQGEMSDLGNHWRSFPGFLPDTLFLQAVGKFFRHVVLIMLGQNRVGDERAVGLDDAFRHHALAFAEKIGQLPGVTARSECLDGIGHHKGDRGAAGFSKRSPSPPARQGAAACRAAPFFPQPRWAYRKTQSYRAGHRARGPPQSRELQGRPESPPIASACGSSLDSPWSGLTRPPRLKQRAMAAPSV